MEKFTSIEKLSDVSKFKEGYSPLENKAFSFDEYIESKKILPKEGGSWEGEVGNSEWKLNLDDIPKRPPGNEETWKEILESYGRDGITFNDGEPDFTPFSEGTVEVEDFTDYRLGNFSQADEKMAKIWTKEQKDAQTWSPRDVYNYRKENELSWHERRDMKTLDLVPQKVHGNIAHDGGISAYKALKGEA